MRTWLILTLIFVCVCVCFQLSLSFFLKLDPSIYLDYLRAKYRKLYKIAA